MLTLALDTAGVDRTTVALITDQRFLAGVSVSASPAEQLVPLVTDVLAQQQLTPADVTRVVVGVGPGPFTGLRIGLAHAHAMGHALGIDVRGVSSLAAVAAAHDLERAQPELVVATDARRKEVYCALVRHGELLADSVAVMTPVDAAALYAGHVIVGDGALKYADIFGAAGCLLPEIALTDMVDYANGLAQAVLRADDCKSLCDPLPAYLREPDAVPSVNVPKAIVPMVSEVESA